MNLFYFRNACALRDLGAGLPIRLQKEALLTDTRVLCLTVLLVCLITETVVRQTDKMDYDASFKPTRLKQ